MQSRIAVCPRWLASKLGGVLLPHALLEKMGPKTSLHLFAVLVTALGVQMLGAAPAFAQVDQYANYSVQVDVGATNASNFEGNYGVTSDQNDDLTYDAATAGEFVAHADGYASSEGNSIGGYAVASGAQIDPYGAGDFVSSVAISASAVQTVEVSFPGGGLGSFDMVASFDGASSEQGSGSASFGYSCNCAVGGTTYSTLFTQADFPSNGVTTTITKPLLVSDVPDDSLETIIRSLAINVEAGDYGGAYLGSGQATASFEKTAWVQLVPITPGMTFETSDGTDLTLPYPGSSVPEPSTLGLMMSIATAALLARRRRGKLSA